jgi:glycosyltransferase involved in cell wall biosynthesis
MLADFVPHGYLHALRIWNGPRWWQGVGELWRDTLQWGAWALALAWLIKSSNAIRYLPEVPNLTGVEWDVEPEGTPSLAVVVPARNEAENIAATLDSLLASDYAGLKIIAVNDRSTDATGTIMDTYAVVARRPQVSKARPGAPGSVVNETASVVHEAGRLQVVHIEELTEGWLGKVFALSVATERSESEYVLYTDADVLFSPSILRRAVAHAEATQADHLVVLPTMLVKTWGEGMVIGFCQIFGMWASRLWKVNDPQSRRDLIGVGAFNLVRRSALEELGGWLPQRMSVVEDITLGRRMKAARMRQRVAFAPGLVLVHWAKGARGVVEGMTKNLFSLFNFQPLLLLWACGWVGALFLLPLAGLLWWSTMPAAAIALCSIGAAYRTMGEISQIDAQYAWLYPLGAMAFIGAMLRSMVVVLGQGGVVWRGTHYALDQLRQHNSPFVWERAARKLREEQLQAKKLVKRAKRKMAKRP